MVSSCLRKSIITASTMAMASAAMAKVTKMASAAMAKVTKMASAAMAKAIAKTKSKATCGLPSSY